MKNASVVTPLFVDPAEHPPAPEEDDEEELADRNPEGDPFGVGRLDVDDAGCSPTDEHREPSHRHDHDEEPICRTSIRFLSASSEGEKLA